jgi:hypothetical protein
MGLSIIGDDIGEIERALMIWFKSQHLTPHDAAFVMAHMTGRIIGMDSSDEKHMREGLQLAFITITESAEKSPKRSA